MKHYFGICLVLITLTALVLFTLSVGTIAADHTISSIRNAFGAVLKVQPQITVNQRVVLTQTAPIAELAVVTKEELVTIGMNEHLEVMSMQIPLTEKKFTAEATYRLKAGFDLSEPFSVNIDPVTHALHATMPHAKIVSVEQINGPSKRGVFYSLMVKEVQFVGERRFLDMPPQPLPRIEPTLPRDSELPFGRAQHSRKDCSIGRATESRVELPDSLRGLGILPGVRGNQALRL